MGDKFTVTDFLKSKEENRKISMLTAYDYPTAKILDESGVDSILVGDSLGMVVLGYEDTTRVTMEDMIHHIKAVVRGTKRALVIGDLPFLSYHLSIGESVRNAGRLVTEGGCKAVKLEGGADVVPDVRAIIRAGIPVVGHLGYTPQSVNIFGGHKAQGRTMETAVKIFRDALALQEAGAFSIVLECVPSRLAGLISQKLRIPVIGIGSGSCDGQVQVVMDTMGMFMDFTPRHAKRYVEAGKELFDASKIYQQELQSGKFPAEENSFTINDEIIDRIQKELM